jgi:hypothetical protein
MPLGLVFRNLLVVLARRRRIGRRFGIENGEEVLKLLDGCDDGRSELGLRPPTGAVPSDPLPEGSG